MKNSVKQKKHQFPEFIVRKYFSFVPVSYKRTGTQDSKAKLSSHDIKVVYLWVGIAGKCRHISGGHFSPLQQYLFTFHCFTVEIPRLVNTTPSYHF